MNKLIPARLYKYQSYNNKTIENLKNHCIWFSKPEKFNDPFDCSISYLMDRISEKNWKIISKQLYNNWEKETDEALKTRTATFFTAGIIEPGSREIVAKTIEKSIKEGLKEDFENSGIACFTENIDDI